MMRFETDGNFPNRVAWWLDDFQGPFPQDGPLGDLDPRRDLDVYINGGLTPVQSFSYDAANNRYLLFFARTIPLGATVQAMHRMPSPPFHTPPLHGAIVAATLTTVTSHLPGSPQACYCYATTGLTPGTEPGYLYETSFLLGATPWAPRTDTTAWDPGTYLWAEGPVPSGVPYPDPASTTVSFVDWNSCILGCPSDSPPDQFLVYDCYISATYADGFTAVLRATQYDIAGPASPAVVTNPQNAMDGDPSTYATISRVYAGDATGQVLQLSQFAGTGGTGATGATGPTGPGQYLPGFAFVAAYAATGS